MKKNIIIALFAIAITTSASAQFYWGAKVGANFNTLNNKNITTSDNLKHPMKAGFLAGFTAEYDFYSIGNFDIGIEADLLYAMKGNGFSVKFVNEALVTNYTEKATAYTDNIQLNFMPKVSFEIADKTTVFARVGPYFDLALSSVTYLSEKGKLFGQDINESDKERRALDEIGMRPFDIGLHFAAGIDYNGLQFAIGYELGLMNLSDEINSSAQIFPVPTSGKMTNGAVLITIGYRF
jgi:hypothetical protein